MNTRLLFLPKLAELSESCPSCPFRDGNDEAFGEMVRKLCIAFCGRYHKGAEEIARLRLRFEVSHRGDFACHHTVYDDDMSLRNEKDHRQCPGATAWFKKMGQKVPQ